jgi:NAD dependent epimerase/dehydratase
LKIEGKKVLVTGAGGFIGSHLVELLVRRGARVTAMVHYDARADQSNLEFVAPEVRREFDVVSGAVEDPFFVSEAVRGKDVVFHLAALIAIPYSYVAPASFVTTNVLGTLSVLEACRAHGVQRLVHTSTSETYGTALYTPIDEKHPLQGQSPYSASKIGADKLAESYFLSFGLPVATIRPFNTYGPRQSARAVIPTIISQALASPVIRLGSLTPVRDLNFVLDTAAGFVAVAESDAAVGEVVNVGTGSAVTIGALAERIQKIAGTSKEIVLDEARVRPEKSEVMQLLADRRKAEALTGWTPAHTLEQGLAETVEFVRQNLGRFRPDVYTR